MYSLRDFLNRKYTSKYKINYDRLIGSGNHALVYEACLKDDCNYVAKISRLGTNGPSGMLHEVKFQNQAANLGIAPRVVDHFTLGSERKAYIIMERVYGQTFKQFATLASDQDRKLICSRIVDMITKLNSSNIIHGDPHERNVIVTRDSWLPMLIDFAWATNYNGKISDSYGLQLYQKCKLPR